MQIKFCLLNSHLAMAENECGFTRLSYTVLRLRTESYQLLEMTACMLHAYWWYLLSCLPKSIDFIMLCFGKCNLCLCSISTSIDVSSYHILLGVFCMLNAFVLNKGLLRLSALHHNTDKGTWDMLELLSGLGTSLHLNQSQSFVTSSYFIMFVWILSLLKQGYC